MSNWSWSEGWYTQSQNHASNLKKETLVINPWKLSIMNHLNHENLQVYCFCLYIFGAQFNCSSIDLRKSQCWGLHSSLWSRRRASLNSYQAQGTAMGSLALRGLYIYIYGLCIESQGLGVSELWVHHHCYLLKSICYYDLKKRLQSCNVLSKL